MTNGIQISPDDGSVNLPELALVIRPGLNQFLAETTLAKYSKGSLDHGNGYSWVSFHRLILEGMPCGISLGFHHNTLTQIHFGVALPNMEMEGGWPTRAAIDEEIAFVRKAFHSQLGREFGTDRKPLAGELLGALSIRKDFRQRQVFVIHKSPIGQ